MTILRWEGYRRSGGSAVLLTAEFSPAVPKLSATGTVPSLGNPGVFLLLSMSEGLNCSFVGGREQKHCCQQPPGGLDDDVPFVQPWCFSAGTSVTVVGSSAPQWQVAGMWVGYVGQPSWVAGGAEVDNQVGRHL